MLEIDESNNGEVRITSGIGTRVIGTQWEASDAIGVYMSSTGGSLGTLGANVEYVTTNGDGNFTSTDPLYYPVSGNVDFLAYYPYVDDATFDATAYSVNVSSQTDLPAIDLMSATATDVAKSSAAVDMTFKHKLSNIVLAITPGEEWTTSNLAGLTVKLVGTDNQATYNLETNYITFGGSVADITLNTAADGSSVEAIVIPQTLTDAKFSFTTISGITVELEIPTAAFVSGLQYVYDVTIDGSGAVFTNASGDIWQDDDDLSDDLNEGEFFSEDLTSSFGTMTTYSVYGGQTWEIDSYGYAKISGYEDSAYNVNEDWLITPRVSLENANAAKLTFETVARYFSDLTTEATIWVSEDYVEGDPNNATWTQLECALTDASDWTFAAAPDVDLTPYAGKVIRVAFKYVSTDSKAGIWEVKNVVISEGQAEVVEDVGSEDAEGSGTESDPYNVAAAIDNQGDYGWVQGYIVGVYNFNASSQFVFGADTINTSILIADETGTPAVYMSVQLPSGDVRDGINLKDNPGNLGQMVQLYGSLEAYCGIEGMKSVTYAVINGVGYGIKPIDTSTAIYTESFASSLGDFTVADITCPSSLTSIWEYASSYQCAKATSYSSGKNAGESYLVSPAIDLSGVSTATLTFQNAGSYFTTAEEEFQLWVSTTSDGTSFDSGWTQLTIDNYSTGSFVWALATINIDAYAGESAVRFAFRYIGTTTSSSTWEIKEFIIQ